MKIPSAAARFHEYPHQFSGGMRQRVMIAIALACEPALLLADEPTTALDVTIQAQVLGLLADLKDRHGTAMLFITHNLGVVAQIADRVAVMYAGQIVEEARGGCDLRRTPRTPTRARCSRRSRAWTSTTRISPPSRAGCPPLDAMPPGLPLRPRCPLAQSGCELPQVLAPAAAAHLARCHVATGELVAAG